MFNSDWSLRLKLGILYNNLWFVRRYSVRWRFIKTFADYWRSDEGIFVFIFKALYLETDVRREERSIGDVSQLWGEEQYWTGSQVSLVWSVPGCAGLPPTLGSHHTQSYSSLCCKLLVNCYQLYIIKRKTFDLISIMNHESLLSIYEFLLVWVLFYVVICSEKFSLMWTGLIWPDLKYWGVTCSVTSMCVVYVSLNLKSVACPHVGSWWIMHNVDMNAWHWCRHGES